MQQTFKRWSAQKAKLALKAATAFTAIICLLLSRSRRCKMTASSFQSHFPFLPRTAESLTEQKIEYPWQFVSVPAVAKTSMQAMISYLIKQLFIWSLSIWKLFRILEKKIAGKTKPKQNMSEDDKVWSFSIALSFHSVDAKLNGPHIFSKFWNPKSAT